MGIPSKGLHVLLEAIELLEGKWPMLAKKITLRICGNGGYLDQAKYIDSLREQSQRLNFVGCSWEGWVTGEAKWEILRTADIFVLPSLTEPFGFSLLEAMSAGNAIIAFATEGPIDIARPAFGRLVPLDLS